MFYETKAHGTVHPRKGKNAKIPYEHQRAAMAALSRLNKSKASYSGLIVLPTGGGKTYTAATWLLKNALDQRKKILWIAHRQFLLDQAANAFQGYAYAEQIPHISSFDYRIISGSTKHDRTIDIKSSDSLIVASKDSIGRNLERLDPWLENEKEVFLVIDEAHHATAKTYRNVIDYVKGKVPAVKVIGLTATPYRTAETEKGLLKMIFPEDIVYSVSLKELINRQILSRLEVEECMTGEEFGKDMGKNDWESIVHMDMIPESIARKIAEDKERNHLIVDTYKKNKEKYGQTIVFAVSINHAIALSALFKANKIRADYIVSSIRDMGTGATISSKLNDEKIEAYKKGDLQVLINVEILTEGIDLPQTKTVFLTRPTVSRTLMTQMVGRALRGVKAGGTEVAYAVSFIDNWDVPFVYPESLIDVPGEFTESDSEREAREVRLISIKKIEEFARLLDETVDSTDIEKITFIQRIPIGMYSFLYLDENGMDISYQVMVYNSNKDAYEKMLKALHGLFAKHGDSSEYLTHETLEAMVEECREKYFSKIEFPAFDAEDVEYILRYYALKETVPAFYSFDDIDKSKLDVSRIAKKIYDDDMGPKASAAYQDELWNSSDDNLLRVFFGRKLYFLKQVEIELLKLQFPPEFDPEQNVEYGKRSTEDMALSEIEEVDPELAESIKAAVYKKSMDKNGYYTCAICGKKRKTHRGFQIDHITARDNGGKTVPDNLQLLCSKCNGIKGVSQ